MTETFLKSAGDVKFYLHFHSVHANRRVYCSFCAPKTKCRSTVPPFHDSGRVTGSSVPFPRYIDRAVFSALINLLFCFHSFTLLSSLSSLHPEVLSTLLTPVVRYNLPLLSLPVLSPIWFFGVQKLGFADEMKLGIFSLLLVVGTFGGGDARNPPSWPGYINPRSVHSLFDAEPSAHLQLEPPSMLPV